MKLNRMNTRVAILRPVVVVNDYGEEKTSWEHVREVWADRVKYSGHMSNEVGEHFADYRATFNVWLNVPCGDGWRLMERGGHIYNVVSVEDSVHKQLRTIVCERVNE